MPLLQSPFAKALLCTCLVLAGGCASTQTSSTVHSGEYRKPAPVKSVSPSRSGDAGDSYGPDASPGPSAPVTRSSPNTAAAGLLQQAAQARASGDMGRAQALAERAQALAPRDGYSYLELARIHQSRGDLRRSRQMALRGLPLAGDDDALRAALEQLSAQ